MIQKLALLHPRFRTVDRWPQLLKVSWLIFVKGTRAGPTWEMAETLEDDRAVCGIQVLHECLLFDVTDTFTTVAGYY